MSRKPVPSPPTSAIGLGRPAPVIRRPSPDDATTRVVACGVHVREFSGVGDTFDNIVLLSVSLRYDTTTRRPHRNRTRAVPIFWPRRREIFAAAESGRREHFSARAPGPNRLDTRIGSWSVGVTAASKMDPNRVRVATPPRAHVVGPRHFGGPPTPTRRVVRAKRLPLSRSYAVVGHHQSPADHVRACNVKNTRAVRSRSSSR